MKYLLTIFFTHCFLFLQDETKIEPESGTPKDNEYTIQNFPGPW